MTKIALDITGAQPNDASTHLVEAEYYQTRVGGQGGLTFPALTFTGQ